MENHILQRLYYIRNTTFNFQKETGETLCLRIIHFHYLEQRFKGCQRNTARIVLTFDKTSLPKT